jgi:tight adherence protein B
MDIFHDATILLFAGVFFLAVFLAVEGVLIWWNSTHSPEAKRISLRIRGLSAGAGLNTEQASILKQRLLANSSPMQRILLNLPRLSSVDRKLVLSGLGWSLSIFLLISLISAALVFLAAMLLRTSVAIAGILAFVALLIPLQYVERRVAQRLKRFEELLPDTLDLIARAMRAGHALPSAFQMVGDEMPSPIGPEFQQTFDEINYGVETNTALLSLSRRVPSIDLNFFVIAVLIQRETGGNLGEILGNISRIIRDRLILLGKVRSLSAEGRLSAWVLCLLPFFTAGMLYFTNPEFMKVLWTEKIGQIVIGIGLVLMFIGVVWIRNVVRIKV